MAKKAFVFEEVGEKKSEPPGPRQPDPGSTWSSRPAIRIWLLGLFALVFALVAVGGLTRLTDSGLSITEWQPVTGILLPMSESAWQVEFDKYQQIPEFKLQNSEMSLAEFKAIYWWEWAHRQLARLTGLVWAAGFAWFAFKKSLPPGWTARLLGIGALGGLQAFLGWWMVSSGLTGRVVDVAAYRLAIHLGLALVILGLLLWYSFLLRREQSQLLQARRGREAGLEFASGMLVVLIVFQAVLGALVAGLDAGAAFPTWPLMNGELLPSNSFDLVPVIANFFENPSLVQFNHRIAGYLIILYAGFVWYRSRSSPRIATKKAFNLFAAILVIQLAAGIMTAVYAAPLHLAIAHQLLGVALLALAIWARFCCRYPASNL